MSIVSRLPTDLQVLLYCGFPLFPCSNKNKRPLTQHGFYDATLDQEQIAQWYDQFPNCAWGSPCTSERSVIDIDPRHCGDVNWAKLLQTHEPIPDTLTTKTGGGGKHIWVSLPPETRCGVLAEGVEIKSNGGYVIVPPSKVNCPEHQGRSYAWEVDLIWQCIAPAPDWVFQLLESNRKSNKGKGKAQS